MSEEPKKEKRGGAGRGQGAKLKHGEPTKTIRLPISLVDKINQGLIDIATLSKAKDIVTDSNDKELKRKIEILQIKVDNYARDIGNMNRRNTDLEIQLKTAKAQILKLKSDESKPEPTTQPEPELNLIPDTVLFYWRYGNKRLVAMFNDDSRVFFKDTDGKRNTWQLFIDATKSQFVKSNGQILFDDKPCFTEENFKGKLPKTLVEKK